MRAPPPWCLPRASRRCPSLVEQTPMPSDLAYWLIAVPDRNNDPDQLVQTVSDLLGPGVQVGGWQVPELKAGTLSGLLTLSDTLPKIDTAFTNTVSKLLDTLRSLIADDTKLADHARVNDRPPEMYMLPRLSSAHSATWKWDAGRWGEGGKVLDVVDALNKEMTSIDSIQKQKLQSYNLAKGGLSGLQRKRTGNLSQRSLIDVVKREDLVLDSEFLETLLVAVPKNNIKDWQDKYERLTSMVVPRSSSKLASDDEFSLFTVTVFKKVHDEFVHKARENRFIVREFTYDEGAVEKQKEDLANLEVEEKELWTDLLRVSRTNFSEAYQLLVHLKTVRLFVESVLRYGLPAEYAGIVVRPDPKSSLKTLKALSNHFGYLSATSTGPSAKRNESSSKKKKQTGSDDVVGEWASVMEAEFYDFVLFEVPRVD